MKTKLLLILLVGTLLGQAQNSKLQNLDINLSTVKYPFDEHFLNLHNQNQDLKMAYMDIQPEKPNQKSIVLLHGKNFNGAYWQTVGFPFLVQFKSRQFFLC